MGVLFLFIVSCMYKFYPTWINVRSEVRGQDLLIDSVPGAKCQNGF